MQDNFRIKKRWYVINHKKVKRLMSVVGVYAKTAKVKYKSYKGNMNSNIKNLFLDKIIDNENEKTYYEIIFNIKSCDEK